MKTEQDTSSGKPQSGESPNDISEERRDKVLNGAFEELVRDDLRSFSLVTTRENDDIIRTYLNAVEGDSDASQASDARLMTAFTLIDQARMLDMNPVEYAVQCLKLAADEELYAEDIEPVDEAAGDAR
jgi:hypothetical protein